MPGVSSTSDIGGSERRRTCIRQIWVIFTLNVPRNWQGGNNLGVVGSRSRDVTSIQNCTRTTTVAVQTLATVDGVASLNHGVGN
jgi:hypothetical protein